MDLIAHPRLLDWWRDDTTGAGRASLAQPEVQRLVTTIAPGAQATDLGGVMSLNVHLEPVGLVLRVHRPFVTRPRLLALQEVRSRLAGQGLIVPRPIMWRNQMVFRCGKRWAELEEFIPHQRLAPSLDAFFMLFAALGRLHRTLATLHVTVPRPRVAIYAPPGTLRRWLPATKAAVHDDSEATSVAQLLHALINRLHAQWVPAHDLPVQLVHGDAHLGNVCHAVGTRDRTREGRTVYLDFGFLAERPRIHDVAYALSWMIAALDGHLAPERFAWESIPALLRAYEVAAETTLKVVERRALVPYTAAARLYHAAIAGFSPDPAGLLRAELPFLQLSEWLLAHPEVMLGS